MARSNVTADREEDALDEKRTPEQREALARLLKLAEEQGVKPLDMDAVLQKLISGPKTKASMNSSRRLPSGAVKATMGNGPVRRIKWNRSLPSTSTETKSST